MNRLSLRQLQIFRAVMRTGSLTAASQALGVSQPAASRLLRHAEDRLGVPLFERRGNGLIPTHEAKALYPDIDRLLGDLDYVERAAEDLRRLQAGRLRIVTIPSLALTIAAEAVGRFRTIHPSVSIQIEAVLNFEVPEVVANRRADLGLAFMPLRADLLAVEEISTTAIVVVMRPDHRLANRPHLSVADLAGEALVSFSKTLPIGALIAAAFEAAGVTQEVAVEVGHSFLACALVRAGAGIAIVDGLAEPGGIFTDLCSVPLVPAASMSAVLLTPNDQEPSLAARAFCAVLREVSLPSAVGGPVVGQTGSSRSD